MEAKYIATTEAIKESLWLQGLVKDLRFPEGVIRLFLDSQSVVHLSKNPVFHERTKHIIVKYHFIREVVRNRLITLEKVPIEDNLANMAMKVAPQNKFKHWLSLI